MSEMEVVIFAVWHTHKVFGWTLDESEELQMRILEWKQA